MLQAWSTKHLANKARPDYLRQALCTTFCDTEVGANVNEQIGDVDMRNIDLGHVNVLEFVGQAAQGAKRSLAHIRCDNADNYILYLPRTAIVEMEHNGRFSTVNPGSFMILQTGRPFEGLVRAPEDRNGFYTSHHVRAPASLLRERIPTLDNFCNVVFPIAPGTSRIMAGMIDSIIVESAHLHPAHLRGIKSSLIDLLCSAVSENIDGPESPASARPSTRELSHRRILDFIEANLSCPTLSTAMISEGCGISVRYLHNVFQHTSWTVAGWIREQRLQRCRAGLRDPARGNRSVTEIALSWGFNDPAHFSRAYKARFGIASSAERNSPQSQTNSTRFSG